MTKRRILTSLALSLLTACTTEPPPSTAPTYELTQAVLVFFDDSSDVLTEQARHRLSLIAADRGRIDGDWELCVTGHTDNSGSPEINERLSLRRAGAVAAYLAGLGIPGRRMVARGVGSAAPLVATPPDTPEPQNRFVAVVLKGGGACTRAKN
jgi:outer membrane protein OmpA-like peptidoglycan-associated protein